jgi:outer membrane protein TolC
VQPVVQTPTKTETIPVAPRKVTETTAPHPVPVSLDTVLRLAQDQNAKVNVAREQIQEAFAEKAVADRKWLPDLWIGTRYWRHEGGIENEDGTLRHSSFGTFFGGAEIDGQIDLREYTFQKVNAERKIWQQRGELSRITSDTLLEAAETYIDLLAAYQGEAIIRATDKDMQDLLKTTTTLAKTEPGFRVEIKRVSAEIAGREQLVLKLRGKAAAARAKLGYLLGVGPDCELVPVDNRLGALSLVDASPPACELVAQALANGPGIREMEGLLALIQDSLEKAKGPSRFIPVVGFRMEEGAIGTGPGDSSDWDNRWDLCLSVRWNLTELVTARDRMRVAQSKLSQVQLSYQDLRAKLTAGVQEARESIHSGRSQLRQSEEQISNTAETLRLSRQRLEDLPLERKSPSEVLLSVRGQTAAQLNYLSILRDYDKAQLRLLVVLGLATSPEDHHPTH